MHRYLLLAAVSVLLTLASNLAADEPTIVKVWPARPPGELKELPPEQNIAKPDDAPVGERQIIKLTNVSIPTLALYAPAKEKNTRTAVIVCPGGGHNILAFDHEGTEVAQWLATQGVSGIVLKYRVPFRNPDKRWGAAVQDAQRAVCLVRSLAEKWEIDANRIGMLGFSAGGETAGLTAVLHEQRQYPAADEIDRVSCRPDFAALIYPGGLSERDNPWKLRDYVKVDSTTPPMFFAHSFDDRVPASNSLMLFSELKKNGVPAELHIYATGGHGWGIRKTGHACNNWPDRCAEWMRSQGWLNVGEDGK